jgi:hypothetical protein
MNTAEAYPSVPKSPLLTTVQKRVPAGGSKRPGELSAPPDIAFFHTAQYS